MLSGHFDDRADVKGIAKREVRCKPDSHFGTTDRDACKRSNYIPMIRKALDNAGFSMVPVISLNVTGLEKTCIAAYFCNAFSCCCGSILWGSVDDFKKPD